MADTNTTVVSGSASEIVVEGMAEMSAREQLAKLMADADAAKAKADKAATRQAKQRQAKLDKLTAIATGTADKDLNPKGHHNPGLLPDTLRPAFEDELINGAPAKGWVVTVRCQHMVEVVDEETGETSQEICGEDRLINTQDAFQTRFCDEHKAEATKAKAKARRQAKATVKVHEAAVAKVAELSDEEVAAKLAELAAQAA